MLNPLEARLDTWLPVIPDPEALPEVPEIVAERQGEFCVSTRTDPQMVAAVCCHGYLPMGLDLTINPDSVLPLLLIKCHQTRTILEFDRLKIPKRLSRKTAGASFAMDSMFSEVLEATVQYWPDRWLTDSLCTTLTEIHDNPTGGVHIHSVEVLKDGALIAGEIGYRVGRVYTSMSGFHLESGAGIVQLVALAKHLQTRDFAFWDLGMEAAYKSDLGAETMSRAEFLDRYREAATNTAEGLELEPCGVAELLNQIR